MAKLTGVWYFSVIFRPHTPAAITERVFGKVGKNVKRLRADQQEG